MSNGEVQLPSLGQRAKSGALYLGLSQIVKLIVTTMSTIVISRLLSPDDYGVVAMATPVVGFVVMFQDLGLTTATVQRKHISSSENNALFWVNALAAIATAVVIIAIAPLVAAFYHDARAGYVTAAASISLILLGISNQHGALLDREMHFGRLSLIDIANASVSFLAAALAAFILRSYWALIIGTVAGSVCQTLLLWRLSSWRPSRSISFRGIGSALSFGSHITGNNVVNFFVRSADNILIGRQVGAAQLGSYDRSYKLMMMPLQNLNAPVNRLLLPLLSRLRSEPNNYRDSFVFAARIVSLASVPGLVVAVTFSQQVINLLLGPRWTPVGPIFFWLGLVGILQPISNMTGNLFISTGRSALQLRLGFFSAVTTLVGFLVGVKWGAEGVAVSFCLTVIMRIPFVYWLSTIDNPVRPGDLYGAQFEPIIGAVVAALLVRSACYNFPTVPLLCLALPLAYLFAIGSSLASKSGRTSVARALRLGGNIIASITRIVQSRQKPRAY